MIVMSIEINFQNQIHLMKLSNSEKIDHEEFIKKMKNSLWKNKIITS